MISVLARMEQAGIAVDTKRLGSSRASSPSESLRSKPRSIALAGRTFNINSGPQLRQVLFDELKLPSLQKTPGGEQSTAQEVLEELALKHPFPLC